MSGGLLPAVAALAAHLGLAATDVGAVDIRFDEAGGYAGFDAASPLTRAGGKHELMSAWRAEIPGPVMFVGDGATDLEAAPATDLFVAFAGIAERAAVTAAADIVVRGMSLAPVVALALGDTILVEPATRALVSTGRALLATPDPLPPLTHR
jgi:phosphoserine phosphatase